MFTDKFNYSIAFILRHEGGLVNNKFDSGKITNFGISYKFYKSIYPNANELDIKNLTKAKATEIYFNHFWKPVYEMFDKELACKVLDMSVNMGNNRSHILLQRALNALGSNNLLEDGNIGKMTLNEIKKYTTEDIIDSLCIVQSKFYEAIVKNNPNQKQFLNGWQNRSKFTGK